MCLLIQLPLSIHWNLLLLPAGMQFVSLYPILKKIINTTMKLFWFEIFIWNILWTFTSSLFIFLQLLDRGPWCFNLCPWVSFSFFDTHIYLFFGTGDFKNSPVGNVRLWSSYQQHVRRTAIHSILISSKNAILIPFTLILLFYF